MGIWILAQSWLTVWYWESCIKFYWCFYIYWVDIIELNSQGCGKVLCFLNKRYFTNVNPFFWLSACVLSSSILGWLINMVPDWMDALRLFKHYVFNSTLYSTTLHCSLIEQASARSSNYCSFFIQIWYSLYTWKTVCFWKTANEAPACKIHMGKSAMAHILEADFAWQFL